MKPTKQQQRQTAIRVARSQARQMGIDPTAVTSPQALKILDDLARVEPALAASVWYTNATDNQIVLFCREWDKGVNGR